MKKSRMIIGVIALFVLGLSSCVSGFSITRQVPATADLHGARVISVEPTRSFIFPRRPVAMWVEGPGDEELTIASGYTTALSQSVAQAATYSLQQAVRSTNHLSLGTSFSADAVIKSEITFLDLTETLVERSDDEANEERSYYLVQSATLALTIQVIEIQSGIILHSATYVDKVTQETLVGSRIFSEALGTYTIVRRGLFARTPSFLPMYEQILSSFERRIAGEIAPSTITEWVSLASNRPKDKVAAEIYKLVDRGEYRLANRQFLALYRQSGDWRWGYNAALLYHGLGELAEAIALMSEVYEHYPMNEIYKALNRMKSAQRDEQKVHMQLCGECDEEYTLITQLYTEGR